MGLQGIELRTVEACGEDWAGMRPVGAARFCGSCRKTVVDVARLTPREVETLALRSMAGEEICARITRDAKGELVTLEPRRGMGSAKAAGVVMAAVVTAGSAAAQEVNRVAAREVAVAAASSASAKDAKVDEAYPKCEPLPSPIVEPVRGCWREYPPATVTGRVLRPNGKAVSGGLIRVIQEGKSDTLYVLDELGTFELHEQPGTYELRLQTGETEGIRIGGVQLHEGYQSFGDVRTRLGEEDEAGAVATVGGISATTSTGFDWKLRLRHPVLYGRYLAYRVRHVFSK